MSELHADTNDFISQITAIIEDNLANEQFGVSELAYELNMSRSNLLRKVKHLTNLSVSQLIRQVRLKRGMDLLRTSSLTVSEIAHQVGFGSTSYFIKCFREHYGYPPGETNKRTAAENGLSPEVRPNRKRRLANFGAVRLITRSIRGLISFCHRQAPVPPEKSIAVLPFKNDSNDSTNIYLINGLMESTLNNLQKNKRLESYQSDLHGK